MAGSSPAMRGGYRNSISNHNAAGARCSNEITICIYDRNLKQISFDTLLNLKYFSPVRSNRADSRQGGNMMSIGDEFAFIQLNTSQASILSKYFQRLCGFRMIGSASSEHAVTYALGNSSPFNISLCLPGVLADLQLCFTEGGEALIPGEQMLDESSALSDPALIIEPEDGGIDGVDHIAIALAHGTLAPAQEILEELPGWQKFRFFDPDDVGHELNAISLRPKGESAILTLVQSPNDAEDE